MSTLLGHLQAQGYDPQDPSGHDGDWYDLTVPGAGTVRAAAAYPDEGYTDVYVFDQRMACEWEAHFSPGTPDTALIAALQAAEWQLAHRRSGPVTPAQAEAAR